MTVLYEVPMKVVKSPDWAAVCDMLIASPEPLCFAITEYDSRILYQFMYRRGYRISVRAVDGGLRITKGEKLVEPRAGKEKK